MVLKAAHALLNAVLPPKYYTHALIAVAVLVSVYTYAQGRKTNRERDLHARTILITVASLSSLYQSLHMTNLFTYEHREPSLRLECH